MTFNDPELERCYESHLAEHGASPGELSQIATLLAVRDTFVMLEGAHSAPVHETIDQLMLPERRAALRRWYQQPNAVLDTAAREFRDQLNHLVDERLEAVTVSDPQTI